MEKEFITSRNLVTFKYYAVIYRLDIIKIGDNTKVFYVTKRTSNKKDEETWSFKNQSEAEMKMREYILKYY